MTFIEAIQAAIANPGKAYVNEDGDWIEYDADEQVLEVICDCYVSMASTWREDT